MKYILYLFLILISCTNNNEYFKTISSLKYDDTFIIKRGFYKNCKATLKGKTYADIFICNIECGNITMYDVELSAKTFIDGYEE